jgi:FixJ family two-component response regulator
MREGRSSSTARSTAPRRRALLARRVRGAARARVAHALGIPARTVDELARALGAER